ncbi:hypothetical protein ACKWTF_003855 [Chironomus riparius]
MRICIEIIFCWVFGIFTGIPMTKIVVETSINMTFNQYFLIRCMVFVVVPTIILIIFNFKIYKIILKQINNEQKLKSTTCETTNQLQNEKFFRREIKTTFTVLIIVVLFALTWIPIHILCFKKDEFESNLFSNSELIAFLLVHSNSIIHPFLYAYRIDDFKNAIKKLWCFNVFTKKRNDLSQNESDEA